MWLKFLLIFINLTYVKIKDSIAYNISTIYVVENLDIIGDFDLLNSLPLKR